MSQKRPIWSKPVFTQEILSSPEEDQGDEPPKKKIPSSLSSSSSLRKSNSGNIQQNISQKLLETSNWIDNFSPKIIDDLAVQHKKLLEIQDWLKHCELIKKRCPGGQILLITGPAGSGKTASVRIIAKEMNYELVEWVSPLDMDLLHTTTGKDENELTFKESQIEVFKRFLFRSSRYGSLFDSLTRKRIVLVEDFPNVFLKSSDGFNEILERYKDYGKSPLIFIVTDSKSRKLNLSYNLFSDQIRQQYQIASVSFNSIAASLMTKAIKRVCSLMKQDDLSMFYKLPDQDLIDSISLTAQGDIRNAIINLHFASLKGAPRLQTKIQLTNSTSKQVKSRSKNNNKILSSVGRDETITMMHALGRVFNPKYIDKKNLKMFLHSPENISEDFSSEPKNFVNFIFANYLSHFSKIEDVLGAIECVSESDVLMTEYREDQLGVLGLNMAVRGIMLNNENPVKAWLPIKGPKKIDLGRNNNENELKKYGIKENVSKNVIAGDYRTYAKIILNNDNY